MAKSQQTTESNTKSIDSFLAPSAFKVSPNHIQIGNQYARTVFLATYPRYLHTNWFSPIINTDRVLDVSIYVNPKNTAEILRNLRDQLARLEAQVMEESMAHRIPHIRHIDTYTAARLHSTQQQSVSSRWVPFHSNSIHFPRIIPRRTARLLHVFLVVGCCATHDIRNTVRHRWVCPDLRSEWGKENLQPLKTRFHGIIFIHVCRRHWRNMGNIRVYARFKLWV